MPFDVEFQCGVCDPSRLPRHWTSLVIEGEVCFAKGERRKWKCLMDAGAQYSVVRPDVVPWCLGSCQEPRNFQTASGDPLPGGQRGVVASLSFQGTREGKPAGWPVKCRAWLYVVCTKPVSRRMQFCRMSSCARTESPSFHIVFVLCFLIDQLFLLSKVQPSLPIHGEQHKLSFRMTANATFRSD